MYLLISILVVGIGVTGYIIHTRRIPTSSSAHTSYEHDPLPTLDPSQTFRSVGRTQQPWERTPIDTADTVSSVLGTQETEEEQTLGILLTPLPQEFIQGEIQEVSWFIDGPRTSTTSTSVYYGTTSSPGDIGRDTSPQDTSYTNYVQDFHESTNIVPLWFISQMRVGTPGTYYYRAHATIEGQHYWSEERSFRVVPSARHKIELIDPVSEIFKGDTATFTWDVSGPSAQTLFSAIYFSSSSTSGGLGTDVDPNDTSYSVLLDDFAYVESYVPIRFVGNARMDTQGTFYYRAYIYVDDKHYWSDEYSIEVK